MTGVKNLIYSDGKDGDGRYLAMKLPRNKSKATHLRITLTPADLYTMEFEKYNTRTLDRKVVDRHEMVYADKLQDVFTEVTGLYTSL